MNSSNSSRRIGLAAAAAALLAGCGGGSGGTAEDGISGIDGTGESGPAAAFGSVTAFGSVLVNGVRYETSSASFTIDGSPGTQDDLAVGDVVLVTGSVDADDPTTGSADTVVFDDNVEGPVESVDEAAGTLVVLGQTVRVTADTSFDDSIQPASLAGIEVGDIVEVSGFVAADGSIGATRIEDKPPGGELELTGRVSALDTASFTFAINAQTVDYSGAMLQSFPGGGPAEGDLVEVKGTTVTAGGVLVATRVELKSDQLGGAQSGDRLEVEGFITRFVSAGDFDVAGFPVTTTTSTQFEGGADGDLGLDIKVEAEGTLNDDGVLVATKIDIRRSRAVRVTALVDSVDAVSDSFVVLGIPVDVDALTRLEDKSDQDLEPFGVDDLAAGDYVEVRGVEFPAGSGRILAGIVEREDPDNETELQGFVTSVSEPSFEILGVTITTGPGTVFEDAGGVPIGQAAFFAELAPGDLVKADGFESSDRAITADEVEFEVE